MVSRLAILPPETRSQAARGGRRDHRRRGRRSRRAGGRGLDDAASATLQPCRILIRGLAARAIIGIRPEERRKRQDLAIDLAVDVRTAAGKTDRIEDAVDYKLLKDAVLRYVEGSRHGLLEALAEGIASRCLRHPGVLAVEVTVDKPGALRFARSVAIQVRRARGGVGSAGGNEGSGEEAAAAP